jgi:hypothetical protein
MAAAVIMIRFMNRSTSGGDFLFRNPSCGTRPAGSSE